MKWNLALALLAGAPLVAACPLDQPTAEQAATGTDTPTQKTAKASQPAGPSRDKPGADGRGQDHGADGHANEHEHHHGADGHANEHEHHQLDDGSADGDHHHHGSD
jgi:hypothetical protein